MPRLPLLIVGFIISVILVVLVGFRQVRVLTFVPGKDVVTLPFGDAPDAVGRAVGIDGRLYGPLTFAVNASTVVVADSYRERLMIFHHRRLVVVPTTGQMLENIAMTPAGQVVMTDNRTLALWESDRMHLHKLVQFRAHKGYSEALWNLAVSPRAGLFVEQVKLGQGAFATWIDEYTLKGRLVRRLASSEGQRDPDLLPLSGGTITEPIRNFTVAPNGHIYVESYGNSPRVRVIHIYKKNGTYLGQLVIRSEAPIRDSALLGVNQEGWVYLAVNMHVPHHARIIIDNSSGHTVATLGVAAVPLYATTYGVVLPSGAVYWDATTVTHFGIRPYRPEVHKVWKWVFF